MELGNDTMKLVMEEAGSGQDPGQRYVRGPFSFPGRGRDLHEGSC
jgi:hypothetical protein